MCDVLVRVIKVKGHDRPSCFFSSAYHVPNWLITTHACRTNTPANTFCRSPGTVPGIYIMEAMMEHVANSLGLDVEIFKAANLYQQGQVNT